MPTDLSMVSGNRLCLDFANLAFVSGDPSEHPVFWDEFVDFLCAKQIVSEERSRHIRALVETDPREAASLLGHAEQLGKSLRLLFEATLRNQQFRREWVEPITGFCGLPKGTTNWSGTEGAGAWALLRARKGWSGFSPRLHVPGPNC